MIDRTKLDRWCDAVLEAGWLAALVVAPMFFNVFSSRVFEPDKISLVRSIALIMIAASNGSLRTRQANAGVVQRPRSAVRMNGTTSPCGTRPSG